MDGSLKYAGFTTLADGADQLDFPDPTILIWQNFYYTTHWPVTSQGVFFEKHYVIYSQVGRGVTPFVTKL